MKYRGRPRPRVLIGIDPDNAYARLGVSPTAPTDEIKTFVDSRIAEIKAAMRERPTRANEDELARLTEAGRKVGTPRARARYDEANPWNELLAVQRAAADAALDPGARTLLVTAALVAELGASALLPSPASFGVWTPAGVPPELQAALQPFVREGGAPSPSADVPSDERQLTIDELHDLE